LADKFHGFHSLIITCTSLAAELAAIPKLIACNMSEEKYKVNGNRERESGREEVKNG
jgi:hypothetical protein